MRLMRDQYLALASRLRIFLYGPIHIASGCSWSGRMALILAIALCLVSSFLKMTEGLIRAFLHYIRCALQTKSEQHLLQNSFPVVRKDGFQRVELHQACVVVIDPLVYALCLGHSVPNLTAVAPYAGN